MQKLKKFMCLLLSALMILSINVPAFAVDKSTENSKNTSETQRTTENTDTQNSPLTIEISTDKKQYKTLGIAEITATVRNTSNEDIQNVSAEAVFTDLAPVGKSADTVKETETLKADESISFTYKATLNKSKYKLNILQKFFLWVVRLFNGGFNAKDNGFDNGRDYTEQTTPLIFGKFEADNVIKVWYGENGETPPATTDEEKAIEGFTQYFDIKKDVNTISEKYETENGYILREDVKSVINEIGAYAEQKLQQGLIKEYSAEIENNCVTITLKSGMGIIYVPKIEGVDSVDISSYQPCLFTYSTDTQEKSKNATDGSAEEIQRRIEDYKFVNNYDNTDVTLDRLKNIGENQVIIWHGHGGYDNTHHSSLMTNIQLDEVRFLLDPIYYIAKIGYTEDYLKGRIICSTDGYVCVTYKFFEHYLKSLNNTFIYLGACSSGKDNVLANTFISKGASAVVVNTDVIHTDYNLDMLESICKKMTNINNSSNQYYTLDEALNFAKEKNGAVCCSEYPDTEVRIWGNSNYRFSNATFTSICLTSIKCNEFTRYTGNVGDSNFTALDRSYTLHPTGTYYGYTNTGVDGKQYDNGFCVWVARWNFGDNISWVQSKFDLAGKYKTLNGKSTLLQSYNTKNFDTSVYFYDGNNLLHSFTITQDNYDFDFSIDVTGVEELTILVKDNKKTAGGTSFALYDMFLT